MDYLAGNVQLVIAIFGIKVYVYSSSLYYNLFMNVVYRWGDVKSPIKKE